MSAPEEQDRALEIEQEKTYRDLEKVDRQAAADQAKISASSAADQAKIKATATAKREADARAAKARAIQAAKPSHPTGVSIEYSPPAGQVREATGSPFPKTSGGWLAGLLGVGVGAAAATFVPGIMPADEKWAGVAVMGALGLVLMVTSPVASIAQEAGIGAVGAAATYAVLNYGGQLCSSQISST